MSLISRIKSAAKAFTIGDIRFETSIDRLRSTATVTVPEQQNSWVYAGTHRLAMMAEALPWKLLTGTRGKPGAKEVPEDDEWSELIARPSPLHPTWQDFANLLSLSMSLYGECPIVAMDRAGDPWEPGDIPAELYILSPRQIFEEVDPITGLLLGWRVTIGSQQSMLTADQVMLVKYPNPGNPFRGLSPMAALIPALNFQLKSTTFNNSLLENGADPGGLLTVARGVPESDRKAARQMWEDRHKGEFRAGRVAVLNDGVSYTPIQVNAKDMQWAEGRTYTMSEILAVIGVTKFDVGMSDDYVRASALSAKAWTIENSVLPLANRVCNSLWSMLFAPYSLRTGRSYWLSVDRMDVPELAYTVQDNLSAFSSLSMHYPLNIVNERLGMGMPEVPWGDENPAEAGAADIDISDVDGSEPAIAEGAPVEAVQDTALNGAQISSLLDIVTQVAQGALNAEAAVGLIMVSFPTIDEAEARRMVANADKTEPPPEDEPAAIPKTMEKSARKALILKTYNESLDRSEAALLPLARGYFKALRKMVISNLNRKKSVKKTFTKAEIEAILGAPKNWKTIAERSVPRGYPKVKREAMAQLRRELGTFNVLDIEAHYIGSAMKRTAKMVKIGLKDRARLRSYLIKQISDQGINSVEALSRAIEGHFSIQSSRRAITIARTESGFIASDIRHKVFEEQEVIEREWSTGKDQFVRESHAAIDGEIRKMGERFSNGLLYPQDPGGPPEEVISCRCVELAL